MPSSLFQEPAHQQDALVDETSTRVEEKDPGSISSTDEENTSEKGSVDQLHGTTSSATIWLITVTLVLSFSFTGSVSE